MFKRDPEPKILAALGRFPCIVLPGAEGLVSKHEFTSVIPPIVAQLTGKDPP